MKNKEDVIDLREVFALLKKKKKIFFIALPIVLVISSFIIISVPRTYSTDTVLAPEENIATAGGSLSDIASSFGINMATKTSMDAIYPSLYPNLMEDNGFVSELSNIKVKTLDGSVDTTYYAYLRKHQKSPWWTEATRVVKKLFKSTKKVTTNKQFDPYQLSELDDGILNKIRNDITISVDKKNDVITIATKAQDALVCKTIADSVRERLQAFVTEYRTAKARKDVEYYKKLTLDAKRDYEKIRKEYVSSADANMDVVLESYKSKTEDLENDMQIKYNTYTALANQLSAARAKLRETTPVFTLLKGAAVPVRPTGPKRMIFVLAMLVLAFICISGYILKGYLFGISKDKDNK